MVNTYKYDVFGAIRSSTGSQANDFQFAGEQVDGSTGLQHLRARYYDVETGRFTSRENIHGLARMPLTQNLFPYALNNPIRFQDPSGNGKAPKGRMRVSIANQGRSVSAPSSLRWPSLSPAWDVGAPPPHHWPRLWRLRKALASVQRLEPSRRSRALLTVVLNPVRSFAMKEKARSS